MFTIVLSSSDLDAIKTSEVFADRTYISFPPTFATDLSGNAVLSIRNTSAIVATNIEPDVTPPELFSFDLNLNEGMLFLSFTEPINVSAIDFTGITFLPNRNDPQRVQLSGGQAIATSNREVTVLLNDADLDRIKINDLLGRAPSTTNIALSVGTFIDLAGVMSEVIPISDPFPASNTVSDISPPKLVAFDFKMDDRMLPLYVVLYFNEVVEPSTLNLSLLTLSASSTDSLVSIGLTGNSLVTSVPSPTLRINVDVINNIRLLPPLGETENSTYLIAQQNLVQDVRGNLFNTSVIAGPEISWLPRRSNADVL